MAKETKRRVMQLSGFIDASEILRSGVYILIHRGVVIYVGKSKAMLTRIYTHRNLWASMRRGRAEVPWWIPIPGIHFDEVHIRPCALAQLDELEQAMIELYKPKYNMQLKTNAKAKVEVGLVIGGIPLTLNARPQVLEIARRV